MESIELDTELKSRLIGSLDKIEEWIKSSEHLVMNEAPAVAQEIVNWGIYGNALAAIVSLVIFIIMLIFGIWLDRSAQTTLDRSTEKSLLSFLLLIFCIVPAACFFESSSKSLKASLTPRVYILEQLKIIK